MSFSGIILAIRRSLNRAGALLLAAFALTLVQPVDAHQRRQEAAFQHQVQPGDTWEALAYHYQIDIDALRAANPHPNPWRNPVVGDVVNIPAESAGIENGLLVRSEAGGVLGLAVMLNRAPWELAIDNGMPHPHRPLHGRALRAPGGSSPPRDLPPGFSSLEFSAIPAQPGWPLAFRGVTDGSAIVAAQLGTARFNTFMNGERVVGIGAIGAFGIPGAPELTLVTEDGRLWSQPWRLAAGTWEFDRITLTGEAAAIDQEAIAAERERMFQIWSQATPAPLWQRPFQLPITDYLGISSTYGARRSYNGGPYSSYHEGVDFSAYRGTPVFAAGDGTVALAEHLYVRGGAVVIDHGLSIFSGYYHMSAVHVQPGQAVAAGDLVGEVGTEGLSSGNHLHWDLLVAGIWVDALAWQNGNLACWILEGWGTPCG